MTVYAITESSGKSIALLDMNAITRIKLSAVAVDSGTTTERMA